MPLNANTVISPRSALWALRVLWVLLAPVMALALASAAHRRAAVAGTIPAVVWWVAVAVVVVALVVPSAMGLTALRMVTPATIVAAAATLALGATAVTGVPALALALVVTLVAFAGEAGEGFVQGSAYGQERRYPLRVPASFLLPMAVAWAVWCAAVVAAVLLLAAQRWIAGAVVAVAAVAASVLLFRRVHRFAQRWLVLVPAGVVVHDPVVLGETLMVQRPNVRLARLALADTQAADLTGPAAGHAVEVTVGEMALAVLAGTRGEPKGRALHVQAFLVAPSRPGRALRAMADLHLPLG